MMQIFLEHVRSFSEAQSIPLRPLTLLVGENSSGKSTFLSVVSSVLDASRFPANPGFNEPPYNLGTFDTIATYKGGKYGRDRSFSIGFSDGKEGDKRYRKSIATYGSEYGNVVLRRLRTTSAAGALDLTIAESSLTGKLSVPKGNGKGSEQIEFKREIREPMFLSQGPFYMEVMEAILNLRGQGSREARKVSVGRIFSIVQNAGPPFESCFSLAPIRSKPRRTYDKFSEEYNPEGDHIPTLLARLLRQASDSVDGRRIHKALLRFGNESGLFKKIGVKRLGKKVSDPFQLQVVVAGPAVSLIDVGYGVGQALPIVVQSVLQAGSKVLLMQQPEVHLHPRAQAALGSFLADLAAQNGRLFLVETHSDHLVDRVRQEVASGNLSHEKVLILFFHKPELETTVFPITIDRHGNVEDAPPEYRSFFLQEELHLFSRTGA